MRAYHMPKEPALDAVDPNTRGDQANPNRRGGSKPRPPTRRGPDACHVPATARILHPDSSAFVAGPKGFPLPQEFLSAGPRRRGGAGDRFSPAECRPQVPRPSPAGRRRCPRTLVAWRRPGAANCHGGAPRFAPFPTASVTGFGPSAGPSSRFFRRASRLLGLYPLERPRGGRAWPR